MCAVLSLIAAYFIGLSLRGKNDLITLKANLPKNAQLKKLSNNPLLYEVFHGSESLNRFVAVEKYHGYGGPVTIGTEVDVAGIIRNIIVIDHKETPAFYKKIQEQRFFAQYMGKRVTAPLVLGKEIDSVSGATVSSTAFSKSIQLGSHRIAKKVLRLKVTEEPVSWQIGFKEITLLFMYAMVFIGLGRKSHKIRYVTLIAGGIFLGFYFNAAISLSNIATLFLGYLPRFTEKMFWWLLVPGAFLIIFTFGKNLYCQWLCPFGAIQELMAKIGGINLQPGAMTLKVARTIPYFLTWAALMIIFLTSNPALGSYEPFATLFGLEGIGVQWYILPVVILGSFFLNRFWCRFFCPVGVVLRITTTLRSKAKKLFKGSK